MGHHGQLVVDDVACIVVVEGGRVEAAVPENVVASRGWRQLRFEGPLPLDQTGILASVTGPLAAARVSLFAVGTYDTDYVLIPDAQRSAAIAALEAAGHAISAGM